MLLFCAAKNNEKDVLDVFDQRTDMPLKREHLVSSRQSIGTANRRTSGRSRKSSNLGLDSFIFVRRQPG